MCSGGESCSNAQQLKTPHEKQLKAKKTIWKKNTQAKLMKCHKSLGEKKTHQTQGTCFWGDNNVMKLFWKSQATVNG